MGTIADFTGNGFWLIRAPLREGYDREVELQLTDTGMRLDPHSPAGGVMLVLPA